MDKIKNNSHSGFNFGVIGLTLILIMIILTKFSNSENNSSISNIIGLLTLGAGITAIIGFVKSLKGLKEPKTAKKIIGIIINFGIVAIFISIIIGNIFDIVKALS